MIQNGHKTSILAPSQLPEFIRDNPSYDNFVAFVQAYYEWMEQNGNVIDQTQNIPNYIDVDYTSQEFLNYFTNDFLQYFPQEILADKRKVLKIAKELYETKGSEASFKLLFRLLYNSDVDFFYTKEAVLRASSGKWYVPKSLLLIDLEYEEGYNDPGEDWLGVQNLRVFGETSKSIATIENSLLRPDGKIEVFISNIERLFESGEIVRLVNSNNQNIIDENGGTIRAKLVGQIGQLKLDPLNRGLLYRTGDPIVIYGGLSSNTGLGAVAKVGTITSGSIQRISVVDGGYGYTSNPNTIINITNGGGAIATVGSLNTAAQTANATFIPKDYIGSKTAGDIITLHQGISIGAANYYFSNVATSNANTTLANAFTFISFATLPIYTIDLQNGGGGITKTPEISAQSLFPTINGPVPGDLARMGILAPIKILNGGVNYTNNDVVIIRGGSGYGAHANVKVNTAGSIISANYFSTGTAQHAYHPLGGMGYRQNALPTIEIKSTNSLNANASLIVTSILGAGATFKPEVSRVGEIQTLNVIDYGQDYISAPTISLKVQDLQIKNIITGGRPQQGDIIYQGTNLANATYVATVNELTSLILNATEELAVWNLRVIDYNSVPVFNTPLKIFGKPSITIDLTTQYNTLNPLTRYEDGVITYGDGTAKATATFLNGLTIGSGQYIDSTGQPSSFDVLQSSLYNNYTYEITVDKEIAKYRETLLNLLHPSGTQAIGRFRMASANAYTFNLVSALVQDQTLYYFTGQGASNVSMVGTFTNPSNNIITFGNLGGIDIGTFIALNDTIRFTTSNNGTYSVEVNQILDANTILLSDNVWLAFANVAVATANAGSNVINITSLTGSYNIVNNGNYSNTSYPLMDIIHAGDTVKVNNMIQTVSSVDYINSKVYLNGNLTYNANGFLSSSRTLYAQALDIRIFGSTGTQYFPELTTEDGNTISTEDGNLILLG